jgi:hypothetical protein
MEDHLDLASDDGFLRRKLLDLFRSRLPAKSFTKKMALIPVVCTIRGGVPGGASNNDRWNTGFVGRKSLV